MPRLEEIGYEVFTSVESLRGYVHRRNQEVAGPGSYSRAGGGTCQLPSGDTPSTWIRLAPLYDVTAASLIDEAVTWGIRRRTASALVTETLDQVLAAIPATSGDARVLAVIREQAERIRRG